jgi:hypothetical protein|tara:strand:+ start:5369 stop:5692 length:324 start_codon:yes stop_codon:yes gene_type:complete
MRAIRPTRFLQQGSAAAAQQGAGAGWQHLRAFSRSIRPTRVLQQGSASQQVAGAGVQQVGAGAQQRFLKSGPAASAELATKNKLNTISEQITRFMKWVSYLLESKTM